MSSATAMDARWSFLQRWCEALDGRMTPVVPKLTRVPTSRTMGVSVAVHRRPQDASEAHIHRVREALVLLALLAREDHRAFRYVMVAYCGMTPSADWDALRSPRFVVLLMEMEDEEAWVLKLFEKMFSKCDEPCSASFEKAVKKILGFRAEPVEKEEHLDVELALLIDGQPKKLSMFHKQLKKQLNRLKANGWRVPIRTTAATRTDTTPALNCVFIVGSLGYELRDAKLSPALTRSAAEIVTEGDGMLINEYALLPRSTYDDLGRNAQTVGQMIEQVLCASGCPKEKLARVLDIKLHFNETNAFEVTRYATAIPEARATETVSLWLSQFPGNPEAKRWLWQRLAYSLFTEDARARTCAKAINLCEIELTEEHAEAIAEVLAMDDPTNLLFGRNSVNGARRGAISGGGSMPGRFILKRGAQVKLHPMHPFDSIPEASTKWELQTDVNGVKVIEVEDEDGWTRVLIPGYGVCKVAWGHLIPAGDDKHMEPAGPLTNMRLAFNTDIEPGSASGVPRFLELVGGSLTHLWLTMGLQEADIYNALAWCPNLKALVVNNAEYDSESFLRAYREHNLKIEELECSFNNIAMVARDLADNTTRIAQHVKKLAYRFHPQWSDNLTAHLRFIAHMLAENKKLEWVHLEVPENAYKLVMTLIKRFDGQPVSKPFPLECRLAFLSVFEPPRSIKNKQMKPALSGTSPLTRFSLERIVLQTIFDFAGYHIPRRVFIETFSVSPF